MIGELTRLKVAASQADDRRGDRARHARAPRVASAPSTRRAANASRPARPRSSRVRRSSARGHSPARRGGPVPRRRPRPAPAPRAEREEAVEERTRLLSRREADLRAKRRARRPARPGARISSQLARQEASLKRTSLEEHVAERYRDVRLVEVRVRLSPAPPAGPEEEARMKELRGLIERMGEINLTAIEESDELQKRYDYLTSQKQDLETAIQQLEKAIDKINRASRKRFREVFDAVNAKFQEVFPRCFGGGRAHLPLTDESDMLETGRRDRRQPAGQEGREPRAALGRREGDDRGLAALRHLPHQAVAVLPPRRGRRAARRGQRRSASTMLAAR